MVVSCIIPAYNEEFTIIGVIRCVKRTRVFKEIIVVDDGSLDNTFYLAKSEGVKVVRHKKNRGKGEAIKTGIRVTKSDIIIFIDADITNLDSSKIINMVKLLKSKKADVVIGTYKFNCHQTFMEVIYKPLMSLLFPEVLLKIKDGYLSGERGFTRKVLEKLHLKDGFDLESIMNIELTFMKPSPRIAFVNLGNIKLKPKGYQKSMEKIAYSIINEAKKYKRIKRLKSSSFIKCSQLLYKSVKKA